MLFSWLKRRRQRAILATPFPADWLNYLSDNVHHYRDLPPAEQGRLRDGVRVFVAEKHWEGCGGLELTDEIKVTITGNACLLVLGLPPDSLDHVRSVLVYPHTYVDPQPRLGPDGLVTAGQARLGEAARGVVVLSWAEVQEEAHSDVRGRNVVLHEFAHQLDLRNGACNGTPPLEGHPMYNRWQEVMTAEYRQLCKDAELGRPTLLDKYGTRNEAEFFAVVTECFFERPLPMSQRHPALYELLRDYYHQHPAGRRWN
jgi:Mlc titration factor MtfA (ptsG expression regulator)